MRKISTMLFQVTIVTQLLFFTTATLKSNIGLKGSLLEDKIEIVSQMNNVLALKMQRAMKKNTNKDDNYVYSPILITNAIAMLGMGAEGDILREIKKTLEAVNAGSLQNIGELNRKVTESNVTESEVTISNNLWKTSGDILPSYIQEIHDLFNARAQNVKIIKNSFSFLEVIDRRDEMVGAKGVAKGLVTLSEVSSSGSIASASLAINTVLNFQMRLKEEFPESHITTQTFRTLNESRPEVTFMSKFGNFKSYKDINLGLTLLTLPFSGDKYYILLVNTDRAGFEKPAHNIDAKIFKEWMAKLKQTPTRPHLVHLPTFKIISLNDLSKHLQKMGIHQLFDSRANLSGINKGDSLYHTTISQRVSIEINRHGGKYMGRWNRRENTAKFLLDKPFFFYLIDSTHDTIILSGRIVNPMLFDSKNDIGINRDVKKDLKTEFQSFGHKFTVSPVFMLFVFVGLSLSEL